MFFGDSNRPTVKLILSASSTSVGSNASFSINVPRSSNKHRQSKELSSSPINKSTLPASPRQSLALRDAHRVIKWQTGGIIGEGGFGKVFLAMNSETGELMAVKQVPLSNGESSQQIEALRREIALIQDLHHPQYR